MKIKTSRLPRRFDKVMHSLGELMKSRSERVRLAAVLRASEILLKHQDAEERVVIATERAQARKAEATQPTTPVEKPSAQDAARAFLASLAKEEEHNVTAA